MGLGWYLPERRVRNAELAEQWGVDPDWIEKASGVRERRYATFETSAGMGAVAARRALTDAAMDLAQIDVIIGASTGPQQAIPCTAALVQSELGAPDGRSACFDINATCLSFLFALHIAAHFIAVGAYRNALIYSSEINSLSLNPKEPQSAALFGDAAAAAVVTRAASDESSAIWHTAFETHSSGAKATEIKGGGTLHHPNDPRTTPEMHLFHMDGLAIFRQATALVDPFLDRFFATVNWERSEVDAVVPHQASRHAVEQLTRRYGFRDDQVIWGLSERGNCVGASLPLTLAEAVAKGRIKRGARVLLVGTGAGLTLGAMALTF
ncbi:MAG TPA: beta-ketoacyl-ACP synthase 3 [Ktedonobacterales bacterium]|nr:beta-ketoacyl-ACP synthase 3 [Ktedonobacterales bacterium]